MSRMPVRSARPICDEPVSVCAQVNVFKQPITDPGKNSKKGRLTLECRRGVYTTVEEGNGDSAQVDFLDNFSSCRYAFHLFKWKWCMLVISTCQCQSSFDFG